MGLLSRGMAWLGEKHAVNESVSVTYTRSATSVTVLAVTGNQQASVQNRAQQGDARVTWSDRDYLIRSADLIDAGLSGVPAAGDRVTETISGVATVFEVAKGPGEPAWEWSEPDRVTYRIHTKRVS